MSLQNKVQCQGNVLDGTVGEMEAVAVEFDRLMGMAEHRKAADYLDSLDPETRKYIDKHPKYGWRVPIAFKSRF